MSISRVPQTLLKRYFGYRLNRYSLEHRLRRFEAYRQWQWAASVLEELRPELFPSEPEAESIEPEKTGTIALPVMQPSPSPYQQYRCQFGDPLNCRETLANTAPGQTECHRCSFPMTLAENIKIWGRRGTYRIERCLGRRRMGRLYEATQLGTDERVVVKEYVLPKRYFSAQEMRQRKSAFLNLAGFALADGRSQDFRVIAPREAIADETEERCYLILGDRSLSPTLNLGLRQTGAMSASQVRWVLNQILQSLEFLHRQKYTLPTGQVQQGLPHGAISLDHLLLVRGHTTRLEQLDSTWSLGDRDFIYLCDLALWETLFAPPMTKTPLATVAKDLADLGQVGFALLTGRSEDEQGQPLDPRNHQHWTGGDAPLKQFILQLMGIEQPFATAEAARHAFLQLPVAPIENDLAPAEPEPLKTKNWSQILTVLVALLALAGLVQLLLAWFSKPEPAIGSAPPLCCIDKVGAVPAGTFLYTAVENGTWNRLLKIEKIASLQPPQSLSTRFATAQPQLRLNYRPADSAATAIAAIRSGVADFAVLALGDLDTLPNDLEAQVVAYDALGVFVAFGYEKRDRSLPVGLRGQITFDQLRQLYIGKLQNWQQLAGQHAVREPIPVKLYVPAEQEIVKIFADRVLNETDAIATFEKLQKYRIATLPTLEMLRASLQDFETQSTGSIGFAPLSQIVGQCSVYPLALSQATEPSIPALILKQNQSIDPTTDLCDRKGSYRVNAKQIRARTYPLSYAIAVVYARDNRRQPVGKKFAEMLKSEEGQRLLDEVGLVTVNGRDKEVGR